MTAPFHKRPGMPNWARCMTRDLASVEAFYASLFGWTSTQGTTPDGTRHALQRFNGQPVADLAELSAEQRAAGVASHWESFVEVADLPEALDRVIASQGRVVSDPVVVPGLGERATIADPLGAQLTLVRSEPSAGSPLYNTVGALTWNELVSSDPPSAAQFYSAVLVVSVEPLPEDPNGYIGLRSEDRLVFGIIQKPPELATHPDTWEVYFAVEDVDEAVRRAVAVGGRIIRPAFDLPVGGRMAILQDPDGAIFDVTTPRISIYRPEH